MSYSLFIYVEETRLTNIGITPRFRLGFVSFLSNAIPRQRPTSAQKNTRSVPHASQAGSDNKLRGPGRFPSAVPILRVPQALSRPFSRFFLDGIGRPTASHFYTCIRTGGVRRHHLPGAHAKAHARRTLWAKSLGTFIA